MAMSDCIKCWETPCVCGWDYRNWTKDSRIKQASVVLGVDKDKLKESIEEYVPEDHSMKGDK